MSDARPGIPGRSTVADFGGSKDRRHQGCLTLSWALGVCIDQLQDFPRHSALQTKCPSEGGAAHRPLGLTTLIHASSFLSLYLEVQL